MDIKIQETNPTRRSVTVTVPAEAVAAAEKEVLKGFSREAALPGFRPGKAPEAIVRQKYGKQIADEVSQRLLSQGYERIQQEKSFTVYTVADVQKEAGSGADAVFRYEVDVVPEFKTPDWKSVKVPAETITVTDASAPVVSSRSSSVASVSLTMTRRLPSSASTKRTWVSKVQRTSAPPSSRSRSAGPISMRW